MDRSTEEDGYLGVLGGECPKMHFSELPQLIFRNRQGLTRLKKEKGHSRPVLFCKNIIMYVTNVIQKNFLITPLKSKR